MSVIEINQRLIDLDSGKVCHGDEVSQLPPKLFTLLNHFIEHGDEVISRDALIEAVWGHIEAATDDSVNVAVSSLQRGTGQPYPSGTLVSWMLRRCSFHHQR